MDSPPCRALAPRHDASLAVRQYCRWCRCEKSAGRPAAPQCLLIDRISVLSRVERGVSRHQPHWSSQLRERSEDDAYTRLKRVIVRARRTGDLDAEAEARKIAGGRAFARSEFRSARDHYRVCAERYEEIGDFANAAEALVSQAKALRAIGDYDRALGSLVHAVTCFQKAGDVVGEAQSLVEGEVIRRMQSGKALSTAELGELTLGRARQSRNRRAETRALLSLATSARGAGRAADARRHANLALELSVRFQHVRTLSAVARLLAEMDIDESDLDAAEVHAAQAVAAGRTGRRKSPLVF